MFQFQIVNALPEHAEAFSQISLSVAYRAETADPNEGFLVFQGTPEEYALRLAQAPDSLLALGPNGEPAAFLLASRQDGFLIVEQIGVSPSARGAGLAQRMYDALINAVQPSAVAASIMHAPLPNLRSIRFFTEKNGFSYKHSFWDAGFEWGLYEKIY